MAAYLSARQAADVCGVSERTVRNWIASGKLSAERSAGSFRIDRDQLTALVSRATRISAPAERNGADSADIPQTPSADHSASPVMLELVHLVAQLQGDVVEKAEAAAMWQARAEMLAQQLERAQLALAAPAQPTMPEVAPQRDSVGPVVESTETSSAPRPRTPWWRRLMWSTT